VTNKVLDSFQEMSEKNPEKYEEFWNAYSQFIKEGLASGTEHREKLLPLLRFPSLKSDDKLISLDEYMASMPEDQEKIYYILGQDRRSIQHSPHLEAFRKADIDVLLATQPLDPFLFISVDKFGDRLFANVAAETPPGTVKPPTGDEETPKPEVNQDLIDRFKNVLGENVSDVRLTEHLVESPARLVDDEGSLPPELQQAYQLLNKDYEKNKKVLELNPTHTLIRQLQEIPLTNPLANAIIEQIYEDALLIEGLHPDPASMIQRIQQIMVTALEQLQD
jgi:molecular chaperone HtpG